MKYRSYTKIVMLTMTTKKMTSLCDFVKNTSRRDDILQIDPRHKWPQIMVFFTFKKG